MVPSEIRAGFDFSFEVENKASEVPGGYTPKFILAGATSIIQAGTVSGDNIAFSFLATDTDALTTGHYWYQVIADDGAVGRVFISDGSLFLTGLISGSGAYDGRSVAEKILEAIDLAMQGKATKDQQSYVIQSGQGSRSLSRCSIQELMEARKVYAAIVSSEKRLANDQPIFKRHKFAFSGD